MRPINKITIYWPGDPSVGLHGHETIINNVGFDPDIFGSADEAQRAYDDIVAAARRFAEAVDPEWEYTIEVDRDDGRDRPCDPPDACSAHGRCWSHSEWVDL